MIEQSPLLDEQTCVELAAVVAQYSLLPHPGVVAQCSGAIFPTRRVRRVDGPRRYLSADYGKVVLDDNVSPRWALLWAHGYERQTVASGWQVAHVWEMADDATAFTNLANLAFVPKSLTRLTDGGGPAEGYLQYHAFTEYGWSPPSLPTPEKPENYGRISWNYLPYCRDVKASLQSGASSKHSLMRSMREIGFVT